MPDINAQHTQMVSSLIGCEPNSERARELRAMIRRLEIVLPALEQQRVEAMYQKLGWLVLQTKVREQYDRTNFHRP